MKITGCETHAVTVNFEGAMSGTHVILRLKTDQGIEGIAYASRVGPRSIRPLAMLMEGMVEGLIGKDPSDTEAIARQVFGSSLGAPVSGLELRAASTIDVACWDLKGKAVNQPVYKLMGGFRDRLPISANWALMPGQDKDKLARHLEDLMSRGFRAVKAPCGFATVAASVDHVKFIRSVVGPEVKIIVDLNFAHTVKSALRFARESEEADLFWIEDPVAFHDYDGMAEVREKAKQNVTCGEVFQFQHQFRWLLEKRCSDNVMIDQDLGLTGFLKVAHMAQAYGCPVINHLSPEALSHPIAAVPNGLIVGLVPWGQPLFTEQMRVENGDLVMSSAPGLGLILDEDVLKRCAIN
jgi:L-alanine-DL-glutamate epimerase-like enolase superfamily enzyme